MKKPEKIRQLEEEMGAQVSSVRWQIDAPRDPDGVWWIDVAAPNGTLSVSWAPGRGFGFCRGAGFGERASEVYAEVDLAVTRVARLLNHNRKDDAETGKAAKPSLAKGDVRRYLKAKARQVAGSTEGKHSEPRTAGVRSPAKMAAKAMAKGANKPSVRCAKAGLR